MKNVMQLYTDSEWSACRRVGAARSRTEPDQAERSRTKPSGAGRSRAAASGERASVVCDSRPSEQALW